MHSYAFVNLCTPADCMYENCFHIVVWIMIFLSTAEWSLQATDEIVLISKITTGYILTSVED